MTRAGAKIGAASALLSGLAFAAAAQADDYWHVFTGESLDSFVDAATIQPAADGSRYAWITRVVEGADLKRSKFKAVKLYQQFACGDHDIALVQETYFDLSRKRWTDVNHQLQPYARETPDTPGAAEYDFVCADHPPPPNDPRLVHLGEGDPVAWSDHARAIAAAAVGPVIPLKPKP